MTSYLQGKHNVNDGWNSHEKPWKPGGGGPAFLSVG